MSKFTDDPEFTSEILTMMGRELKQARQRIKDLESFKEAYTSNDVLSPVEEDKLRDFRERTDAAEEAMEIMRNHVQNVNKENQRLRLEVASLQNRVVKQEPPTRRKFCEQGVSAVEVTEVDKSVQDLESALEKYYHKYVNAKKAKVELEEELKLLMSTNGALKKKEKDAVALVDSLQNENEILTSKHTTLETQLRDTKIQIDELEADQVQAPNYRSLFPIINNIGNQVASTPPTSQPVCFLGVDLGAYLRTDPRTQRYSNNVLYSPDLLQFPDGSGRSALWLRPLFEFDGRSLSWTTRPPLGKVFTVFYPMKGRILYAGQYTVSQVFPRSHKDTGYLISNKDANDAKVIELITSASMPTGDSNGTRMDAPKFFTGSVLQVGAVALKFKAFDTQLHDILGQRFQASLPVGRSKNIPRSIMVKAPSVGNTRESSSNGDSLEERAKHKKRKHDCDI